MAAAPADCIDIRAREHPTLAALERAGGGADVYSVAGYRAMFLFCLGAAVIALVSISFMKETLSAEPGHS